jgi:hypothetical protein
VSEKKAQFNEKDKPNTAYFEEQIIGQGDVVEGYTLRYLRQIRDLLIDIRHNQSEAVKEDE